MKKVACLMLTLLLCGCQVNETDLKNELTSELNELSNQDPVAYTTMNKPLYSYYLPKDVGRIQSNPLSSLFMKDGVKFIMNFNPNEVVIHDYYQMDTVKVLEETVENGETALFYEAEGTFRGSDDRYHEYKCQITQLDDGSYLLLLDMEYVNFTAILKAVQIQPLIRSMFIIAKSLQYDSNEVIAQYSLRSSSESVMSDLEEFNQELPDSGSLSELIDQQEE